MQEGPAELLRTRIREACLSHAADLLSGARLLEKSGLCNLALNYAVIAIEEVGKSVLVRLDDKPQADDEQTWSVRSMDDHVRKLFFAIWAPTFGRQVVTKHQIDDYQGYALRLHSKRISSLYVPTVGDLVQPRDAVPTEEVRQIIKLGESRLELEQVFEKRELTPDEKTRWTWFLKSTREPEMLAMIFSEAAMVKLAEIGDFHSWLVWVKAQFDDAENRSLALLNDELTRRRPADAKSRSDKWRLKIRLQSHSHGIRQKSLDKWNQRVSWTRIFRAGKPKAELLIEFTLPNIVLLNEVWWMGWGCANSFIIALNIGTMGYFWWLQSRQVDRYYEEIIDLEHGEKVDVKRTPGLRLDWGQKVLDDPTLHRVQVCWGGMPSRNEAAQHAPFNEYLAGLAYLGKSDIHLSFEVEAYSAFWRALREGLRVYGEWDGKEPYSDAFERIGAIHFPTIRDRRRYYELGAQAEAGLADRKAITLSEVGAMKLLADRILQFMLERTMRSRSKIERVG